MFFFGPGENSSGFFVLLFLRQKKGYCGGDFFLDGIVIQVRGDDLKGR